MYLLNSWALAGLHLAAVVAANLTVAAFGPSSVLVVGFLIIGFNLIVRDAVHEQWADRWLPVRMGALIAAGGGLSYLVNHDAAIIAIASMLAFVASETTDALIYQRLLQRRWFVKANLSNAVSATVDSAVFITVAFGFTFWLIAAQSAVKILGGVVWSMAFVWLWNTVVAPEQPDYTEG